MKCLIYLVLYLAFANQKYFYTIMKQLIIISSIILLTSCSSVKIYTNEKDFSKENEVGLKFYQPKPFLLIEYNPAKDVNIKTSIVYFPDLSSPRYIKVRSGWGSANATVGFANGVMNSYGAISDSKGPETITGLASAVTSLGGAALSLAQVDEIQEKIKLGLIDEGGEQAGGGQETIELWKKLAQKLDGIIGAKIPTGPNQRQETGLSKLSGQNPNDEKERTDIIDELEEQLKLMLIPTLAKVVEIVESLRSNAQKLKKLNLIETPERPGEARTKDRLAEQLEEIVTDLTKESKTVVKHWELFEITFEKGKYNFNKNSFA